MAWIAGASCRRSEELHLIVRIKFVPLKLNMTNTFTLGTENSFWKSDVHVSQRFNKMLPVGEGKVIINGNCTLDKVFF